VLGDPINKNDPTGLRAAESIDEFFMCIDAPWTGPWGWKCESSGSGGEVVVGGGRQPSLQLFERLQQKLGISEGCARGMVGSGKRMDSIERANQHTDVFKDAAAKYNIDWRLVAAVAVRESGVTNRDELGGSPGRGIFQITPNDQISEDDAEDIVKAADYAAGLLATSVNRFTEQIGSYLHPWAVGARGYNTGPYNRFTLQKLAEPDYMNALDRGTALNSYVSSVVNLMECFEP
jgi:hypothetical protein